VKAAKPKLLLPARIRAVIDILRRTYPDFRCALVHDNPLQLLVATILSAQCTDERVNQVTPALFARYRDAAEFGAASLPELEALIRPTGFFRNKAKSIRSCCRAIAERFGGRVPDTLGELIALDGIGRKTANVVLGVGYGKAEGIVVDTHVQRLSHRLGFTRQNTPEKIESALMKVVPRADWIDFSHLLIWHGRNRCTALRPDCPRCEVCHLCPRISVARTAPV